MPGFSSFRPFGRHGVLAGLLFAVGLGVATGIGVWLFKRAIGLTTELGRVWYEVDAGWGGAIAAFSVPVLGGLAVGILLHVLGRLPEDPGHGVTEVIEAVKLDTREMRARPVVVKAPAAAVALGSGASLGPEDPAVEIGGSFGAWVGRRWGWSPEQLRGFIAAGAAAGVSAAFHAPLAALVFAAEVFGVRPLSRRMAGVLAAALAAYLTMRLLAPETVFRIPEQDGLNGLYTVGLGLGVGAASGVVAAGLVRGMYALRRRVLRWSLPLWAKPTLGGVVLGGVAVAGLPELLGIGYGVIQTVVEGEGMEARLLGLLLAGKLLLIAVSFGTGFPGGFFAPSFFAGAMLGGLIGLGASGLVSAEPVAIAIAGMAALLAGVVHAPVTAVLLLAAVSDTYSLIPLLLVAAVVSYAVSKRLSAGSAYTYAFGHPLR